jgi:integrase
MPISEKLRSQINIHGPYEKEGTDRLYGRAYDTSGTRKPKQKWFSLGTDDYRLAEDELKYRKMQIWSGEWDPWKKTDPDPDKALGQAIEEYLGHYRQGRAEKTVTNRRKALRLFREHVGAEVPIGSVTADDVQSWLATPSSGAGGAPSPYTLRTYYDHVKGLLEWSVAEGLLQRAPTEEVKRPEAGGKTYRVLRPSEADELIAAASALAGHAQARRRWLINVLNFNLCAGLRLSEICALRWADVGRLESTSDMATVQVRPYHDSSVEEGAKGFEPKTRGSVREVDVFRRGTLVLRRIFARERSRLGQEPPAKRLVFRYDSGNPIGRSRLMNLFRQAAEESGLQRRGESGEIIEGLRPHDLRHTWISWLVNEYEHEIGIRTVADMAGHEDTDMTEQYRKQNPASRRSAMLRAVGEEEEDGRRPTYEAVAEWLQSVPAGYPTKGPNFGKNTVSRTTDVETG